MENAIRFEFVKSSMLNIKPTIGIVNWTEGDGVAARYAELLAKWGYSVAKCAPNTLLPKDIDAVLVHGPLGSLAPIIGQLEGMDNRRPVLALWMSEQFPNPNMPEWLRQSLGRSRSYVDRLAHGDHEGLTLWHPGMGKWMKRANRYRYYGDLLYLRDKGLLDVLAVSSAWTTDFLNQRGITAVNLPFGCSCNWGRTLDIERDIPVIWLGKMGSKRRRTIIGQIRVALAGRGIPLLQIDGEQNPFVFGEERTRLLNRTRIMLNVLRMPWDNNAQRFCLASLNGAAVVTEPTFPHTSFVPGVHLIDSQIGHIADSIADLLNDEQKRTQIAANARLLTEREYLIETNLATIMDLVNQRIGAKYRL